ncbi:MAG: acyl-CoA thioesterase [Syntrophales bacterium]|nr:acyl-CoA thioesterase [Syntrophales bacterium]
MFKKTITPRISETNLTGHIGHSAIPVWLEEGYADIIKLFDPDPHRPPLILAHVEIDYIGEIFLGKDVTLITGVAKVGKTSLTLYQEISQNGRLCAQARSVFVRFDYETRQPRPIEDHLRVTLTSHRFTPE